jgi:hypothetical protein
MKRGGRCAEAAVAGLSEEAKVEVGMGQLEEQGRDRRRWDRGRAAG